MINIDLTNEPNCIKKKMYSHTKGMGKNRTENIRLKTKSTVHKSCIIVGKFVAHRGMG